jgi:carbon storage regulator
MLVLTRKLGEKIYIGDNIVLTVVDIKGGKIRLGIDAPAEVPILRAELNDFIEIAVPKPVQPNPRS